MAMTDQTRSLPDGELNVLLRHKPPFRFWDRAMNVLMTEAGWLAASSYCRDSDRATSNKGHEPPDAHGPVM